MELSSINYYTHLWVPFLWLKEICCFYWSRYCTATKDMLNIKINVLVVHEYNPGERRLLLGLKYLCCKRIQHIAFINWTELSWMKKKSSKLSFRIEINSSASTGGTSTGMVRGQRVGFSLRLTKWMISDYTGAGTTSTGIAVHFNSKR